MTCTGIDRMPRRLSARGDHAVRVRMTHRRNWSAKFDMRPIGDSSGLPSNGTEDAAAANLRHQEDTSAGILSQHVRYRSRRGGCGGLSVPGHGGAVPQDKLAGVVYFRDALFIRVGVGLMNQQLMSRKPRSNTVVRRLVTTEGCGQNDTAEAKGAKATVLTRLMVGHATRHSGEAPGIGVDMSAVGFEPTSANTVELESTPLDRSGTLTIKDTLLPQNHTPTKPQPLRQTKSQHPHRSNTHTHNDR